MVGKWSVELFFTDYKPESKEEHDEAMAKISIHDSEEEGVCDDGERS